MQCTSCQQEVVGVNFKYDSLGNRICNHCFDRENQKNITQKKLGKVLEKPILNPWLFVFFYPVLLREMHVNLAYAMANNTNYQRDLFRAIAVSLGIFLGLVSLFIFSIGFDLSHWYWWAIIFLIAPTVILFFLFGQSISHSIFFWMAARSFEEDNEGGFTALIFSTAIYQISTQLYILICLNLALWVNLGLVSFIVVLATIVLFQFMSYLKTVEVIYIVSKWQGLLLLIVGHSFTYGFFKLLAKVWYYFNPDFINDLYLSLDLLAS